MLGTAYDRARFFNDVVTRFEFGPWFAWLAIDSWRHRQVKLAGRCLSQRRRA